MGNGSWLPLKEDETDFREKGSSEEIGKSFNMYLYIIRESEMKM